MIVEIIVVWTIPFKDFGENHINIEKISKFRELDFLG